GTGALWVGGLMRDDHDAIAISNGDSSYRIEKEKSWQVTALLKHYWTPNLHSNVFANYASVTPGTTTQNTDWTKGGLGKASQWAAGANLYWMTTKTAEIGIEAIYRKARQTLAADPGDRKSVV